MTTSELIYQLVKINHEVGDVPVIDAATEWHDIETVVVNKTVAGQVTVTIGQ